MSVLNFPRLYFRGLMSWDPGVVNNTRTVYDAVNVRIILPAGVTFDTFKQWVINNPRGNWNYYGTHTCQLVGDTAITGGAVSSTEAAASDDPILGKPIQFQGKLVDLDPASIFTSQIFFENFSFGDENTGVNAERHHRFHSRWINFDRNLGGLDIAGNAGVVWQTVFPREKFQLANAANSPLLTALKNAIAKKDAEGLMVRFAVYRTIYFQNGILNDIPQQPRNINELFDLYRQGLIFSNPAYSMVAGVIGVWNRGEVGSVPGGRYLVPTTAVAPMNVQSSPVRLGPCVAEVNHDSKLISLDFNSTIPEIDISLTKADFGPLTLAVRKGKKVTPIATITPDQYAQAAYDSSAGIIDIPIKYNQIKGIEAGQLILQAQQAGQTVDAMSEVELVAQADDRDTYLNEASPKNVEISVNFRGKRAAAGTRVLVARYDRNGNRMAASIAPPVILKVGAGGKVPLTLNPQAPGFINFGLFPFDKGGPQPTPPPALDIMIAFFLSLRTLPFDNEFEAKTPDSQITWKFVYENILRVYDLLNPVMASPSIGLPLFDKSVWTNPGTAQLLKQVTAESNFENFNNMPVTRELSNGMRKLLHRFCDLVISGTLPPDVAMAELKPEPTVVPLVDIRLDLK